MAEFEILTASIANTIKTYRAGEILEPDADHVAKWSRQFSPENALPFLREFDCVIKKTFLSKVFFSQYFNRLIQNVNLAGPNPREYWRRSNMLNIQIKGHSQRALLEIFAEQLRLVYQLDMDECGEDGGDYIYLDDVVFTGGRAGSDLKLWIENHAPINARLNLLVAVVYAGGEWSLTGYHLKNAIAKSNKNIVFRCWRGVTQENRAFAINNSDVLWPAEIPEGKLVTDYLDGKDVKLRKPGGSSTLYSSEAARKILEHEFVVAGIKIRSKAIDPNQFNRPLGCSNFGFGFGAIVATYRNCPNNAPLAIWWGDKAAAAGALNWYPLMPRKTY